MAIEVPSPIDLRVPQDAAEWESSAMAKRPWRSKVFECFAAEIIAAQLPEARILELGSGPGFLAEHLLAALPKVNMTCLDFSAAMHSLAKSRLERFSQPVSFIERSFKKEGWSEGLGKFHFVVTNQAVHELRHKSYASKLHQQVRGLLVQGGVYLVCDHYVGQDGMRNSELYMSLSEQQQALESAGYKTVRQVLVLRGLALHAAA